MLMELQLLIPGEEGIKTTINGYANNSKTSEMKAYFYNSNVFLFFISEVLSFMLSKLN